MRAPAKFVLLVDDDPSDRKLFSRYLENLGLKVIATGDPDKAMQQIVAGISVALSLTRRCSRPDTNSCDSSNPYALTSS
jgi:CheY-like chemotaxis protein